MLGRAFTGMFALSRRARISPLLYAVWAAFHGSEYAIHFDLFAPLTLDNFRQALDQARQALSAVVCQLDEVAQVPVAEG